MAEPQWRIEQRYQQKTGTMKIASNALCTMTQPAIKLDLLEQIVVAPDLRQTAEAALMAFRGIVPGEHFSAMLFNAKLRLVEDYFLHQSWQAANTKFWPAAQQRLAEHPLAEKFLSQRQSTVFVRSRVVLDSVWRKTWLYNEVERPLDVEDLATVCQIASAEKVLVLTCGRSGKFSDRDLAPVHSFQRVLNAVIPSCPGVAKANAPSPGPAASLRPATPLTAREGEVLHWLRQFKRNAEIATILGVSLHTVRHHLEKIYAKLGVETRMAAAHTPGG
jgi:DNA-binding CsgD family transcriptional regulator